MTVYMYMYFYMYLYRRQHEIELCLEQRKQQNKLGAQHQQKYHYLLSLLNNQY